MSLSEPQALLGLPRARRWILNGPYADQSLLRNALAYQWARQLGLPAPRTRFVELYLNDDGDPLSRANYHGIYLVTERIEAHPNRVPLTVGPTPSTTGYLFHRDRPEPDEPTFTTLAGECFIVSAPEAPQPDHLAFLKQKVDEMEALLLAGDPRVLKTLDVESFVDHALLLELSKNPDGFYSSTYFFLPAGGKLHSGPPWDFNAAFGGYRGSADPSGWWLRHPRPTWSPWGPALFRLPAFRVAFDQRYLELRRGPWSTSALLRSVDRLAHELGQAYERNSDRWLAGADPERPVRQLKDWLRRRLQWLDGAVGLDK